MVYITKEEAMKLRKEKANAHIVRLGHNSRYAVSEEPDVMQCLALMRGYKDQRLKMSGSIVPARIIMLEELNEQ